MSAPSLSVVLPLYNGQSYVEKAIQSILMQVELPHDYEIIIVDDGSDDTGVQVCQSLAAQNSHIRLDSSPVNRGVAFARNRGVQLARYEYLAFIDQDDEWRPGKWQQQYGLLQKGHIDYVLGLQAFTLLDPTCPPTWFRAAWLQTPQKGYVLGAMLIKSADFLRVGLLDESLRFGGDDVDWFARAKSADLRECMDDTVVLGRLVHNHNASARTKQSTPELLYVLRQKLQRQREAAVQHLQVPDNLP